MLDDDQLISVCVCVCVLLFADTRRRRTSSATASSRCWSMRGSWSACGLSQNLS